MSQVTPSGPVDNVKHLTPQNGESAPHLGVSIEVELLRLDCLLGPLLLRLSLYMYKYSHMREREREGEGERERERERERRGGCDEPCLRRLQNVPSGEWSSQVRRRQVYD